jgi:predicted metal-dependent hydrolase
MVEDAYLEYVELFNERSYYDCHEVLEDLWLDYEGPARRYYQGLIHLASAYLLLMRGKMPGCQARFKSTLVYFDDYPDMYLGLDLAPLRENVKMWLERISAAPAGERVRYVDADVPMLALEFFRDACDSDGNSVGTKTTL